MKKYILLTIILFVQVNGFSQELNLKKISHTQFFKMIKAEKDSVFELKNAIIEINDTTDSLYVFTTVDEKRQFISTDTLIINKAIILENVHFVHNSTEEGQALHHIIFNKKVSIKNTTSILFYNCVFNAAIDIDVDLPLNDTVTYLFSNYNIYDGEIGFYKCLFKNNLILDIGTIETYSSINLTVKDCDFKRVEKVVPVEINVNNIRSTEIENNIFFGDGFISFTIDTSNFTSISVNDFNDYRTNILKASLNSSHLFIMERNVFNKEVILNIDDFNSNHLYRWSQWRKKLISSDGFRTYIYGLDKPPEFTYSTPKAFATYDSLMTLYKNKYRYRIENAYKDEMRLLGNFYDFYKKQHDTEYANEAYVELKELETKRFAYLYSSHPSFKTYFTWKINQFLDIFSAYGTKPSQAVVASIYVVLFFAFIYLFFPNSWDSMSRNKLMRRMTFFTKYFRKKEGIKEIYEDERRNEIMSFNEFRTYMNESKKEIPGYFIWLAKPIYYFSSYNYKMTGRILKYTDILKGKWIELPPKRRYTTSLIMALWIFILIVLDLFVKFLNALTLSINTFTTLGFGEIPIKGLPRYLAIIEGFIGWFMLTIFSVSLISQLLN
jgi:Ion channel